MAPRKPNTPKSSDTSATSNGAKRERKQYAEVNLSDLKPVEVTKQEKATVLPGRERSEAQKAVDGTVRDVVMANIANGLPKQFRDMKVIKYTLPTEQAETVRFMIGKACTYLNAKPKFGKAAWDNGMEVVTFSAVPRDASQWTDKVPGDAEKADETAEKSDAPKLTDPAEFAEQ